MDYEKIYNKLKLLLHDMEERGNNIQQAFAQAMLEILHNIEKDNIDGRNT